jgi:transcriptional regulator GlxA family with amidase domain
MGRDINSGKMEKKEGKFSSRKRKFSLENIIRQERETKSWDIMKDVITVLYDDFETLDVFGPVEILGTLADRFNLVFASRNGGIVTSSQKVPVPTVPFGDLDSRGCVLLIPGGVGTRLLVKDRDYIDALHRLADRAAFILTVCTGSILLSKTGILDGKQATSNKKVFAWTAKESPAVNWIKKARFVKDGNIYTSSGVSAGIDMALGFVADQFGRETALQVARGIEYEWHEDPAWDPFAGLYG